MHAESGMDNLIVRCLISAHNEILVMERDLAFSFRTFRDHRLETEHQQDFLPKESSESNVYNCKPIRWHRIDG